MILRFQGDIGELLHQSKVHKICRKDYVVKFSLSLKTEEGTLTDGKAQYNQPPN